MRSFKPKGDPHEGGWSSKFISFAKSLEMNLDQDPVAAFIARWNLNEDAQKKLWQLPPPMLMIAINDFMPPADTEDCNGMMIKFGAQIQKRARDELGYNSGEKGKPGFKGGGGWDKGGWDKGGWDKGWGKGW